MANGPGCPRCSTCRLDDIARKHNVELAALFDFPVLERVWKEMDLQVIQPQSEKK